MKLESHLSIKTLSLLRIFVRIYWADKRGPISVLQNRLEPSAFKNSQ